MTEQAIQELMLENFCFGCGPTNAKGLQIKSHWDGEETVCTFEAQPHHAAGPKHVLNGGIIATLIDCHGICTAVAKAHRNAGREIGSHPLIWFVTGSLSVRYLKPTPINEPVLLRAEITEEKPKKMVVNVTVSSGGEPTAEGEVIAIRVDPKWLEAN